MHLISLLAECGGCGVSQLHIQAALRNGTTPADLLTQYGVKHRRHSRFHNLVLFKYDQIASDFTRPIVRECRGIVLDEADGWRVVCRSFDKFFNHGEGHAAEIDWGTARVQEKLDGSLCNLYHYAGEWHVATSGTPDASGQVHGSEGLTFAEYFWATFRAQGGKLPRTGYHRELVFSFELMGPANRIVVEHATPWLRLLGIRDRVTHEQYDVERHADLVNIEPVRSFPLTSFAEMEATFLTMSPLSQEGYVVVDANWNRVKVKSPAYVALHHAKDGMTDRAFVEIARSGETSEVDAAFPEIAVRLNEVRAGLDTVRSKVAADFDEFRGEPDQKSFALRAVHRPWSGLLFAMRKGVPLNDAILNADVDRLLQWMRLDAKEAA